jgi:hypothetical protein
LRRWAVPPLELLELNFSVVRDATPLLASRSLRVLRAYGVPWDVESYDVTLYEWRLGDHGEPAPAIELSRRSEWRVCHALFAAGVEACLATLPGRWTALVRPGIHAGQDYCEGYPEQMVPALAQQTPASWSEAAATGFRTTSLADAPVDRFQAEWESGTDADARRWVASTSLDDGDRAALARFISRFSDATFWREPAAMQATEEKRLRTRIPSRLARLRSDVLAGIRPDEPYLRLRVDGFDHDGPHGAGDGWFVVGLLGYGNDERRTLLHDELGLFPIGDSVVEAGYTEFAVNLRDSDDPIVYEYRTQELFHARSSGQPVRVLVRPAFTSVASMFGHVTAYSLDDRVVEGAK